MSPERIVFAGSGGGGVGTLALIFVLWICSKVIEVIWEYIRRSNSPFANPTGKDVEEVLLKKQATPAVSSEVSNFLNGVNQEMRKVFSKKLKDL